MENWYRILYYSMINAIINKVKSLTTGLLNRDLSLTMRENLIKHQKPHMSQSLLQVIIKQILRKVFFSWSAKLGRGFVWAWDLNLTNSQITGLGLIHCWHLYWEMFLHNENFTTPLDCTFKIRHIYSNMR